MRLRTRNQKGFALAVALAAIVVIGGLIVGAFFASTQEYRIGRNTVLQARALTAAENGLYYTVSNAGWDNSWNTPAGPGVLSSTTSTLSDGSLDSVLVTALGNGTYNVVSVGRSGPGFGALGRRRIGALVALAIPQVNLQAALTTRGTLKVGGSSNIDGADNAAIPFWTCPPTTTVLAGVAIPDPSQVSYSGCKGCISGMPPVQASTQAGQDSTYNTFGDATYAQLAALAQIQLAGGQTLNGIGPVDTLIGGVRKCNKSPALNWGDPLRSLLPPPAVSTCSSYFPIIHANGDLHITGGQGQGILLVDGNLSVDGGFQFFGPVIVQGTLVTQGTGGHFVGGVLASNVNLAQNTVLGNAVIQYSSCALARAIAASASPVLAKGRSWTELF